MYIVYDLIVHNIIHVLPSRENEKTAHASCHDNSISSLFSFAHYTSHSPGGKGGTYNSYLKYSDRGDILILLIQTTGW